MKYEVINPVKIQSTLFNIKYSNKKIFEFEISFLNFSHSRRLSIDFFQFINYCHVFQTNADHNLFAMNNKD